MNNDKLAVFLSKHKYNCENFNEEGNYDPNPYWLADEIVEFLNLQNVSHRRGLLAFCEWYKTTDFNCEGNPPEECVDEYIQTALRRGTYRALDTSPYYVSAPKEVDSVIINVEDINTTE